MRKHNRPISRPMQTAHSLPIVNNGRLCPLNPWHIWHGQAGRPGSGQAAGRYGMRGRRGCGGGARPALGLGPDPSYKKSAMLAYTFQHTVLYCLRMAAGDGRSVMARSGKVTAVARADIVASYQAGEPVNEIARRHGVSGPTIVSTAASAGLKLRGRGRGSKRSARRSPAYGQVERILEMHCAGKTVVEIAAFFGVAKRTISRVLRRSDVKIKPHYRRDRAPIRVTDAMILAGKEVCGCHDIRIKELDGLVCSVYRAMAQVRRRERRAA